MPDGGDIARVPDSTGRESLCALFDGSLEGFLCVIFDRYYNKHHFDRVCPEEEYQQSLGAEYIYISTDFGKAGRVMDGIGAKISPDAKWKVWRCFLAADERKYAALYEYILLGFRVGAEVDGHLRNDSVLLVHKLAAYVGKEAHLLKGFCRFARTASGVYYAPITPVNNPLPILAEHFKDRLGNQAWIIHDKRHGLAAVYDGNDYTIQKVPKRAEVELAEDEMYQELWRAFHESIGIETRRNYKLQRKMLPLRYRENITEFNKVKGPGTEVERRETGADIGRRETGAEVERRGTGEDIGRPETGAPSGGGYISLKNDTTEEMDNGSAGDME
ncbi:MAG: TIGR03915 family putative DNA repair protein [Firmicutes bacterium]|nr:TIGR03915 family putative DNA repair protein [Bacillota bacterium]